VRLAGLLVCLMAFSANLSAQQELSTFVYSAEEDLEEAFRNGEIDFSQLLILQELIRFGIDSSSLYLLDEIPNLSHFLKPDKLTKQMLRENQKQAFVRRTQKGNQVSAVFLHSLSKVLTDDQESRYRTSLKLNLNNSVTTLFRIHREYSGSERLVYRSVRYNPESGFLKRLTVGNYSDRLGLGTVFGYRGKLLNFSRDIESESLLFPDYGGHNGISINLKSNSIGSKVVVSHLRDTKNSLTTTAGSFEYSGSKVRPMVLLSHSRLRNRESDEAVNFYKFGFGSRYDYSSGYNQTEITVQTVSATSFGAAVTEGRHFVSSAEIKYSGWIYSDDFIDLSSSSKHSNLSTTEEIEIVEYKYSNKRSGQSGLLFKTVIEPAGNIFFINSLVYASSKNDEDNFEFLSAVTKSISSTIRVRFDFLSRTKNRIISELTTRRTRAELRYTSKQFSMRTYLTYNTETDKTDHMSFFANVKVKTKDIGKIYVWGNLREINHNSGKIDSWYGYIENQNNLFENLSVSTRFSHSYRRANTIAHLSTVSVGMKATI